MRVITGSARGRRLTALEGNDVRPTTDKVKEAIFSIVQFDISGSEILDLFSGSGQLGIEALSRGAKHCTFVDEARASVKVTTENVKSCGFSEQSDILNTDAMGYLRTCRKAFDVAFLDPPYNKGILEKALPLLAEKMSDRGIIVCEHESGLVLDDAYGKLMKRKTYKYGKIEVTVFAVPFGDDSDE